jgi:hypothetical protein
VARRCEPPYFSDSGFGASQFSGDFCAGKRFFTKEQLKTDQKSPVLFTDRLIDVTHKLLIYSDLLIRMASKMRSKRVGGRVSNMVQTGHIHD